MAAAGAKNALCVIQQPARSPWRPAARASRTASPSTENIQVNGADDAAGDRRPSRPSSPQDKSIDWIVTLGAPHALDAIKAMDAAGSKAKVGTFDLNADAAQAIKDGKIQFSIDQQPYVQGYLAVSRCTCTRRTATIIGGGQPC